ncbi:tail tube monomer [Synechococcus phage DSL-LC02]|nr:tail tube monomer [Synechococcus phage DSL-LC02]
MAEEIQLRNRTLDSFKSKLTGGGARPNLFECVITPPTWARPDGVNDFDEKLRLLVKTAGLPASNISPIQIPFRGRTLSVAGDRSFDSWTITVINDSDFGIRRCFEKWMNGINKHQDTSGYINPNGTDGYQQTIAVHQLGRSPYTKGDTGSTAVPVLRSYKLYGCWPSNVGAIPLSYDDTNSIEQYDVTFEVQWWEAFKSSQGEADLR